MKKIISIIGSETFLHEDLKSMFQDISEKDLIVKSVSDGEIIADNKGTEIVIKFGKFNVENISNDFKTEVSEFRNVLRESVGLLKKQGLIDKSQLEKLASQFAFLGDAKTKETKALEQEPGKEAKREVDKEKGQTA